MINSNRRNSWTFLNQEKYMTLRTYLLICKRINLLWLFWIFINSLWVYLNGVLSAKAISTIVNYDFQGFLMLSGAILVVNLLWVLQIYQNAKVSEKAIQAMCNEIRKDILQKIEGNGVIQFESKSVSAYTSWLTNDIQTIRDLGFETLELMISQALNIIFAVIAFLVFITRSSLPLRCFSRSWLIFPRFLPRRWKEKPCPSRKRMKNW